jgi:radical S-adenosyl methionine domain-containing protein 2
MNTCILPETVNYHFTSACNMRCRFCFAGFSECHAANLEKHKSIIRAVAAAPVETGQTQPRRLNFVGGEPTVYPYLEELLLEAKVSGLRTSVVTNGFKLVASGLPPVFQTLELLGLSIDSLNHETNLRMGRSVGGKTISTADWMELFEQAGSMGLPIKINTTVTAYNVHENLSNFMAKSAILRWKLLQGMIVKGQNERDRDEWEIYAHSFDNFARNNQLHGANPEIERESFMRGSYAMISPDGRFFDSVKSSHTYSQPILEVGIEEAWKQVSFDPMHFNKRTLMHRGRANHD